MEEKSPASFSQMEWENCIKVLSILKDNPLENPDNQLFGTLITKIYKKARKELRPNQSYTAKLADRAILFNTTINKNALSGQTLYWDEPEQPTQPFTKLQQPRNCYCCNRSYQDMHFFYGRLCPECAHTNYRKRFENQDLTGRKAILTGGRVKVGYATALRLLRNNATVVVTTRFPATALHQFMKEEDYTQWQNRLTVYGLDLRNLQAVNEFVTFYNTTFESLDILINNAAQTIRYTDTYYQPILSLENNLLQLSDNHPRLFPNTTAVSNTIQALDYDAFGQEPVSLNRFGQPIDNRDKNSWNSNLDEIPVQELLEVNLINQISPFLLISSLKPSMKRSPFERRFIINVTSSEGIFSYTNKTSHHPHTNMTKASLNMMTLTSAGEFALDRIYMSCVDVGWISTGASEQLRQEQFEKGYIPPLDPVDGASRIVHPIFRGLETTPYSGVLLKNYMISEW